MCSSRGFEEGSAGKTLNGRGVNVAVGTDVGDI